MHADTCRPLRDGTPKSRFDGPPGLSGELWPVHPHRFDDELLSSWIVRTAHANRIKVQTFTTLTLGRREGVWNRDIDRCASDVLLTELARRTGSSIEELRGGMLSGYEGILYEQHNPMGNSAWILPLGIYHRTRRDFGLQYCPLCLFADPVPYFRKSWRLAFVTICDRHGNLLHDRCCHCGTPVIPFRNDLGKRTGYKIGDVVSCCRCGFDLRRAPATGPSGPDGKTIMALRSLVAFHDIGWWYQEGSALPLAFQYFQVLRRLASFLTSPRGRRLARFVEEETGWIMTFSDTRSKQMFERRPIAERHQLLIVCMWLLDNWPDRFLRAATKADLKQSRLLLGEEWPYWFEDVVRSGLGAGGVERTAEEVRQAAALLVRRGNKVSARAIGRLIGGRDSLAAKAHQRTRSKGT